MSRIGARQKTAPGATGYSRLQPGITDYSRAFFVEPTGCDRLRPATTRHGLCGSCVVDLMSTPPTARRSASMSSTVDTPPYRGRFKLRLIRCSQGLPDRPVEGVASPDSTTAQVTDGPESARPSMSLFSPPAGSSACPSSGRLSCRARLPARRRYESGCRPRRGRRRSP